ncbi:MAG: endonuclease III [Sutterellaceae bacterium]|nr:endonuclease III [Sutterellaceae bacterium]
MNNTKRNEIVRILAQVRPNPVSELNWNNPFELLIAVMLSAQATDKGVNAATPALFEVAPTPQAMSTMTVEEIENLIKTIGLYRNKAKNALAIAKLLCEKFNGQVPDNFDDLITLPGVGEKTAKVVLNVAFGKPYIAVDTHIFRVAHRTGMSNKATPSEVGAQLEKCLDKELLLNAHHWILLHGRYCCKARTPDCKNCPIVELCEFKEKNL